MGKYFHRKLYFLKTLEFCNALNIPSLLFQRGNLAIELKKYLYEIL